MSRVISASRRLRKTGAVAGIRVDACEVGGSQREAAIRVVDGGGVVQEEGTFGLVETALRTTEDEGAEFEAGVDIGKEGRQIRSQAAILKVEQAADPPAGGDRLEERSRGLISVDTRGRKQTYYAFWPSQIHGTLDEERVEVDSASAQNRICTGLLDVCSHKLGSLAHVLVCPKRVRPLSVSAV